MLKKAKDIEVVSEEWKETQSSIERLNLLIKDKTIMIRRYEEKYDREFNGERANINGKTNKAVTNSSKK